MKSPSPKKQRRKALQHSRGSRARTLLKWTIALVAIGLVAYGLSQMSSVAYTDRDLGAISFVDLNRKEKQTALEAANRARCTCGCGMTLAQCVATDSTCPLREGNIGRIRTMVEEAKEPRPKA